MAQNRKLTEGLYICIKDDLRGGMDRYKIVEAHKVSLATIGRISQSKSYEDYFKRQNEQRKKWRDAKNKFFTDSPRPNLVKPKVEIRTSKKDIADAIMVLVDEGYLKLEVK